ncbi:MAG: TetR/AcrR family transcriptional regulator, partial [Candidatus Enteromonas sp.]|nr:TetR/AcrR family transcriptional regulator [Candidatus Enteromonas sp.]
MPKVIDDPVTRILRVTKKTILNRPGFSFTMEDIALQAEMSLPSIYSRFHGLSDLCYEVIRYSWAEETKRLKSLAKGCIDYKDLIITLLTFLHEFIVQYSFPFSKVKAEKKEEVEEIIQNTI